jgi:large subunit ribosomal protein L54
LKGLNFKKNAQDPLALEDEAYPAWLWRVLDKKAGADDVVGGEGDMFCKSLVSFSPVGT